MKNNTSNKVEKISIEIFEEEEAKRLSGCLKLKI